MNHNLQQWAPLSSSHSNAGPTCIPLTFQPMSYPYTCYSLCLGSSSPRCAHRSLPYRRSFLLKCPLLQEVSMPPKNTTTSFFLSNPCPFLTLFYMLIFLIIYLLFMHPTWILFSEGMAIVVLAHCYVVGHLEHSWHTRLLFNIG